MAITSDKVVLSTTLATDKLLGSYSNQFFVPAPAADGTSKFTNFPITTNIPETTFAVGIFSVNGGTTWSAFESEINHADNQGSITVRAESRSGSLTIVAVQIKNIGSTGSYPFTVQFKVMMIAKPDQGKVTAQPIGSNVYFDSRKNYQKIVLDESKTLNGTNQQIQFDHNLGYIPRYRCFYEVGGVLRTYRGGFNTFAVARETAIFVRNSGTVSNWKVYVRVYGVA